MTIKTLFLAIFEPPSSIAKSFFECRLSGVETHSAKYFEKAWAANSPYNFSGRSSFSSSGICKMKDTQRITTLLIPGKIEALKKFNV